LCHILKPNQLRKRIVQPSAGFRTNHRQHKMTSENRLVFHVITLFPELIRAYCSTSVIGRGLAQGHIAVAVYDPRDLCLDNYRKVDDVPYGGGPGMVLQAAPIFKTFESIPRLPGSPVIITTPQGCPLTHSLVREFFKSTEITIICGHYEGIDERVHSLATHEVSIGDYILTGGELAAMVIIDAVGRLVPGVLGKSESLEHESFIDHLLEGPQYTKPQTFRGMNVPEILLSGDHAKIAKWRRQQALKRTAQRRPDMLKRAQLTAEDVNVLSRLADGDTGSCGEGSAANKDKKEREL
jgi:tRNA (guanine37-N1)-methyltransferase